MKTANLQLVNSTAPRLPYDLMDIIVGLVDPEDRATLLACCLTSRNVLHTATKTLFRHVHIRLDRPYLSSLLGQIMCSEMKSFALTHLEFTKDLKGPTRELADNMVADMLHYLPNVKELSVHWLTWNRVPDTLVPQAFSASSVTRLTLRGVVFGRALDMLHTICAFPRLNALALNIASWTHGTENMLQATASELPTTIPRLRSLDVYTTSNLFVKFLFRGEAAHNLEAVAHEGFYEFHHPQRWYLFNVDEVYEKLRHITCYDFVPSKHSVNVEF